jgi:hypothetical protein
MTKIAFLSLNYSDYQKTDLIKKFFYQADDNKYNLYIHPKYSLTSKYFKKYTIPQSYIKPTKWGTYSLVEATISLMKYAIEHDQENTIFILISDSHCPLFSFDTTYNILNEDYSLLSFQVQSEYTPVIIDRFNQGINKKKNNPFILDHVRFVSQWFVCNRYEAITFTNVAEKYKEFFYQKKQSLVDEIYFPTVANLLNIPYQEKNICSFDWFRKSSDNMISLGCRERPHTYEKVSKLFIRHLRKAGFLFLRKIHKETILDQDFLLST